MSLSGAPSGLTEYIRAFDGLRGWFMRADLGLLCAVNRVQQRTGIRGNILEIGVYAGKSAVLLGFLLTPGEQLHVCDPFEEVPRTEFEATYRRFHGSLPVLWQGRSREVLRLLPDQSCRIVHVDGAHDYESVRADIAIARRVACRGGMVVFVDFPTFNDPDVTAAVLDEVRAGDLTPLVMSHLKLYAGWSSRSEVEIDGLLAEIRSDRSLVAEVRPLFRSQVIAAWGPPTLANAIGRRLPAVHGLLRRLNHWWG